MDASGTLFPWRRARCPLGSNRLGPPPDSAGTSSPRCTYAAGGGDPAAWRSLQQALLEQERLVDVLDGLGLLGHRDRERAEADRLARERRAQRVEDRPVDLVEPTLVDLEQGQGGAAPSARHRAVAAHLGVVAHPLEQTVGDAWRAPGAAGDLACSFAIERHAEDAGGALEDRDQILGLVVVEAGDEAEAVAQRAR